MTRLDRMMALAATLALAILAACSPTQPVGRCTTEVQATGTARVVSIAAPTESDGPSCPGDAVRVLLRFTPSGSGEPLGNDWPLWLSRGNPPRAWVEAQGLAVGTDHPAQFVGHGPCPPTIDLTAVDRRAGEAACR